MVVPKPLPLELSVGSRLAPVPVMGPMELANWKAVNEGSWIVPPLSNVLLKNPNRGVEGSLLSFTVLSLRSVAEKEPSEKVPPMFL